MIKYSLRARMMLLISIPTLLIGVLLTAFFVVHRYYQLQDQLIDSGSSVIEPLAVASKYNIVFHNKEALERFIKLIREHHSDIVRSITIFDANNKLFVTSVDPEHYQQVSQFKEKIIPSEFTWKRATDSLILHMPIMADHYFNNYREKAAPLPENNQLGYITIELDLKSLKTQQYNEISVAFLLLIVCLCIAMLLAYRLMINITLPIRNMANTVDSIRQGQLDSRVTGHMFGELSMLKDGINAMAISLTEYHQKMQHNINQATSELRETLEQMEIQNIELDLAKKRAQEAARVKSEFLANMSHELRTPLNGVIGFTRQLLKTSLSTSQTDYLQTIEKSANNLLTIINDVLDFSKLEAGQLQLEHIPFSLRETIDEVITLLAYGAHEKGIELSFNLNSDIPEYVIGDPLRLQQIITNLLGNAIKFTDHGNIDIQGILRSKKDNEIKLEFQVHDTGIGIAPKQQKQLFQAFRQADTSISRCHGGTGLGLVISQRLVKQMGGEINFYSQLNKGTTFWFQIQLEIKNNNESTSFLEQTKCLKNLKLLYVEQNPTVAKATLNILANSPMDVVHSTSMKPITQQHFDILLLGVPLNEEFDLQHYQIKLSVAQRNTNHIILALPSKIMGNEALLKQLGNYSYLSKPISQQRLLNVLLQAIKAQNKPLPPQIEQETITHRFPMTVMAVDDNLANLKLIGALLSELVEETILCDGAAEALEIAKEKHLDIILMDIQMPKIDGIKATELIHQISHHAKTPVVAVTAHIANGEQERLIMAGMDGYLTKPIDEIMLSKLLARYNNKKQDTTDPKVHDIDHINNENRLLSKPHTADTQSANKQIMTIHSQFIDWELALKQVSNKEHVAKELLTMLVDSFDEIVEHINVILDGGNNPAIMEIIHKFHGSCSYCGVPNLKNLCFSIEKQLKNGVSSQELEPEWLELLDEIENIRNEYLRFVNT